MTPGLASQAKSCILDRPQTTHTTQDEYVYIVWCAKCGLAIVLWPTLGCAMSAPAAASSHSQTTGTYYYYCGHVWYTYYYALACNTRISFSTTRTTAPRAITRDYHNWPTMHLRPRLHLATRLIARPRRGFYWDLGGHSRYARACGRVCMLQVPFHGVGMVTSWYEDLPPGQPEGQQTVHSMLFRDDN